MMRIAVVVALFVAVAWCHPLDDYVNLPDDSYTYSEVGSFRDEDRGVTVYHLNMTSQTWQDPSVSTQSVWFHYMAVVVPDTVVYSSHGTMFISWGDNDDDLPTPDNDDYLPLVMDMAQQSGMVCTLLNQVPNQPILFHDDPKQMIRSEDDLIAYTIKQFAQDGRVDPSMIALFPMTKAAIRGMDTIQDFANNNLGLSIENFALAGGSKRGWTTYLASATDPLNRVFAITPLVFSLVNFEVNLMKHYQCLGGWSWAMAPYHDEGLAGGIAGEFFEEYAYLVDPYALIERYTFPTLIIVATGDEFFFPHESKAFIDDMPGPTYFMMLENTQHFLIGHHDRLVRNIVTFVTAAIEGHQLPVLSWEETYSDDNTHGILRFTADQTPTNVTRWTATTTSMTGERRDYRMLVKGGPAGLLPNPIVWFGREMEPNEDGVYEESFEIPADGYRGFYMTAEFDAHNGHKFEATTEVHNLPDTFPFPECTTVEECQGEMV